MLKMGVFIVLTGVLKAIGVSNYREDHLLKLLHASRIRPSVLQVSSGYVVVCLMYSCMYDCIHYVHTLVHTLRTYITYVHTYVSKYLMLHRSSIFPLKHCFCNYLTNQDRSV